jgi:predicted nucleotidyltransferase
MREAEEKEDSAYAFYREALQLLIDNGAQFLLGGGRALQLYIGIIRDMKDLDIFCKSGDFPRLLKLFADNGYETEISDARWLGKVFKGEHYIDFIFNTVNNICRVDDSWFERAVEGEAYGLPVKFIGPEELFWCKSYVQNRERYDGADLNHMILKYGDRMDWHRVWHRIEHHWQLLLGTFLNFQFVYPAERDLVPRWLFDELLARAREQYDLPASLERVCRGPLVDNTQYSTDVKDWDYKSMTIKTI